MSESERALLDTNVLVYALYEDAAQHAAAYARVSRAQDPDAGFCVVPQVLIEFYAVITNPRRVSKPCTSEEARHIVNDILRMPGVVLLPVPIDLVDRWLELLRGQPVTGARVFDLQLAATMLGNGVTRIYTFNRADFESVPSLAVLEP